MFFTAGGLLCLLMTGSFSRQAVYMPAWYMQAQIKYYLNTIAVLNYCFLLCLFGSFAFLFLVSFPLSFSISFSLLSFLCHSGV